MNITDSRGNASGQTHTPGNVARLVEALQKHYFQIMKLRFIRRISKQLHNRSNNSSFVEDIPEEGRMNKKFSTKDYELKKSFVYQHYQIQPVDSPKAQNKNKLSFQTSFQQQQPVFHETFLETFIESKEETMNVKYGDIVYIKLYNKSRKRIISGDGMGSNKVECIFLKPSIEQALLQNREDHQKVIIKNGQVMFRKCLFQITNAKQYFYFSALQKEIKEKKRSALIEKQYEEERKNNEKAYQNVIGKNLTYDEPFQLLHIFSSCTLTLNPTILAVEDCCKEISLEEQPNEWSNFIVRSSWKNLKNRGEAVLYSDRLTFVSCNDPNNFFMHVTQASPDEREDALEVNSSELASLFQFKCFLDYNTQKQRAQEEFQSTNFQSGDIVRIISKKHGGCLALQRHAFISALVQQRYLEVGFKQSIFQDYIPTENIQQDLASQYELYFILEDDGNSHGASSGGGNGGIGSKSSTSITSKENSPYCLWEIQRVNMLSDLPKFGEVFNIKHLATGLFLSFDSNTSEVRLVQDGSKQSCLFLLQGKSDQKLHNKQKHITFHDVIRIFPQRDSSMVLYANKTEVVAAGAGLAAQMHGPAYNQQSKPVVNLSNSSFIFNNNNSGVGNHHNGKKQWTCTLAAGKLEVIRQSKETSFFTLKSVTKKQDANIICSINTYLLAFYLFLQNWGICYHQGEFISYDHRTAIQNQKSLLNKLKELNEAHQTLIMFIQSAEMNEEQLFYRQNLLFEFGIVDLLLMILKLINCMVYGDQRQKESIIAKRQTFKYQQNFFTSCSTPQSILYNASKSAVRDIYKILILCSRGNNTTSSFLLNQNSNLPFFLIEIHFNRGIVQSLLREAAIYLQEENDSDIIAWSNNLRPITSQNISDQALFVEIIRLIMSGQNQSQQKTFRYSCLDDLVNSGSKNQRVMLRFSISQHNKVPFVEFTCDDQDLFESQNYSIVRHYQDLVKQGNYEQSDQQQSSNKFELRFFMDNISDSHYKNQQLEVEEPSNNISLVEESLPYYQAYILNFLQLYSFIAKRHKPLRLLIMQNIGLTQDFIFTSLSQIQNQGQLRFCKALLNLYKHLILEAEPLKKISLNSNFCFLHSDLYNFEMQKSQPYQIFKSIYVQEQQLLEMQNNKNFKQFLQDNKLKYENNDDIANKDNSGKDGENKNKIVQNAGQSNFSNSNNHLVGQGNTNPQNSEQEQIFLKSEQQEEIAEVAVVNADQKQFLQLKSKQNLQQAQQQQLICQYADFIVQEELSKGYAMICTNWLLDRHVAASQIGFDFPAHVQTSNTGSKDAEAQLELFLGLLRLQKSLIDFGYNNQELNQEIEKVIPAIFYPLLLQEEEIYNNEELEDEEDDLKKELKEFEYLAQQQQILDMHLINLNNRQDANNMEEENGEGHSPDYKKNNQERLATIQADVPNTGNDENSMSYDILKYYRKKYKNHWIIDFLPQAMKKCKNKLLKTKIFMEAISILKVLSSVRLNLQTINLWQKLIENYQQDGKVVHFPTDVKNRLIEEVEKLREQQKIFGNNGEGQCERQITTYGKGKIVGGGGNGGSRNGGGSSQLSTISLIYQVIYFSQIMSTSLKKQLLKFVMDEFNYQTNLLQKAQTVRVLIDDYECQLFMKVQRLISITINNSSGHQNHQELLVPQMPSLKRQSQDLMRQSSVVKTHNRLLTQVRNQKLDEMVALLRQAHAEVKQYNEFFYFRDYDTFQCQHKRPKAHYNTQLQHIMRNNLLHELFCSNLKLGIDAMQHYAGSSSNDKDNSNNTSNKLHDVMYEFSRDTVQFLEFFTRGNKLNQQQLVVHVAMLLDLLFLFNYDKKIKLKPLNLTVLLQCVLEQEKQKLNARSIIKIIFTKLANLSYFKIDLHNNSRVDPLNASTIAERQQQFHRTLQTQMSIQDSDIQLKGLGNGEDYDTQSPFSRVNPQLLVQPLQQQQTNQQQIQQQQQQQQQETLLPQDENNRYSRLRQFMLTDSIKEHEVVIIIQFLKLFTFFCNNEEMVLEHNQKVIINTLLKMKFFQKLIHIYDIEDLKLIQLQYSDDDTRNNIKLHLRAIKFITEACKENKIIKLEIQRIILYESLKQIIMHRHNIYQIKKSYLTLINEAYLSKNQPDVSLQNIDYFFISETYNILQNEVLYLLQPESIQQNYIENSYSDSNTSNNEKIIQKDQHLIQMLKNQGNQIKTYKQQFWSYLFKNGVNLFIMKAFIQLDKYVESKKIKKLFDQIYSSLKYVQSELSNSSKSNCFPFDSTTRHVYINSIEECIDLISGRSLKQIMQIGEHEQSNRGGQNNEQVKGKEKGEVAEEGSQEIEQSTQIKKIDAGEGKAFVRIDLENQQNKRTFSFLKNIPLHQYYQIHKNKINLLYNSIKNKLKFRFNSPGNKTLINDNSVKQGWVRESQKNFIIFQNLLSNEIFNLLNQYIEWGLLTKLNTFQFFNQAKELFTQTPIYLILLGRGFLYINRKLIINNTKKKYKKDNALSQETKLKIQVFQNDVTEAGIHKIALKMFKEIHNFQLKIESFKLLREILIYGNQKCQSELLYTIQSNKDLQYTFLNYFQDFFKNVSEFFQSLQNISYNLQKQQKSLKDYIPYQENKILTVKTLHFLQLCCENSNSQFQYYFRKQEAADLAANTNIVLEVCSFLCSYLQIDHEILNYEEKNRVLKLCMQTLIEFCTGDEENKKMIYQNKPLFIEIFNTIHNIWKIDEMAEATTFQACINFLLSFIKDNNDLEVMNFFLNNIKISRCNQILKQIYTHIESRDDRDSIYQDQLKQGKEQYDSENLVSQDTQILMIQFDAACNLFIVLNYIKDAFPLDKQFDEFFSIQQQQSIMKQYEEDNQLQKYTTSRMVTQKTQRKSFLAKPTKKRTISSQSIKLPYRNRFFSFFANQYKSIKILLESFKDKRPEWFMFYKQMLGCTEIRNHEQKKIKIYFRKPFCSKYLSMAVQRNILELNKLDDVQTLKEKAKHLLHESKLYYPYLVYQQEIQKYRILSLFVNGWRTMKDISFMLVLFITIMQLLTYDDFMINDNENYVIITKTTDSVSIIQLIIAIIVIIFCAIERFPLSIRSIQRQENYDYIEVLKHEAGYQIRAVSDLGKKIRYLLQYYFQSKFVLKSSWKKFLLIIYDSENLFNIAYLVMTILAFKVPYTYSILVYSLLLLEIVKRSISLQNIIQSITQNADNLLKITLFGLIMLLNYGIIGYLFFKDEYNKDSGAYSNNLIQTIFTTIKEGLRYGEGISNAMLNATPPEQEANKYWPRYAFDLSFYIIISILFINIIFGIILDTFSELRTKKSQMISDLKDKCYICGKTRMMVEVKDNQTWYNHIYQDHNVFHMFFYIMYIRNKNTKSCDVIERYVKTLIQQKSTNFFPHELIEDSVNN